MNEATTNKSLQEESMEDILHSIRDIIAEEEGGETDTLSKIMDEPKVETQPEPVAAAPAPEPEPVVEAAPEPEPAKDVLELTEVVKQPADVLDNIDAALKDVPPPVPPKVTVAPAQTLPPTDLISNNTTNAASDSMRNLLHSIPRPSTESPVFRGGLTVEDLVMEALKPMLSEWLERNLATLVEDVVQREIRKLVPRE